MLCRLIVTIGRWLQRVFGELFITATPFVSVRSNVVTCTENGGGSLRSYIPREPHSKLLRNCLTHLSTTGEKGNLELERFQVCLD